METHFNSLSEILMKRSTSEKGITFIESEKNEDFLSYRELYDKAAYVLYNLVELGVKPGNELVFQFQSQRNFVITFWACILGKIAPVPVTPGISHEVMLKLARIWKLLNHPFLITDIFGFKEMIASFEKPIAAGDIIANIQDKTIYFDDVSVNNKKAEPLQANLEEIAFIQFSSGSTGHPKGVINTHESLIYNIYHSSKFCIINSKDKTLSWVPLTHDMGLIFFHILPVFNNISQYLIPPLVFLTFPSLWIAKAGEHQVTITGSPNFGYKYYLDHFSENTLTGRSLEHIRIIINSAEPISFSIGDKFLQTLSRYQLDRKSMCPSYGLAESTLGVCSIPLSDELSEHFVHRDYLNIGDQVQFVHRQNEKAVSFVDLGISAFTSLKITDEAGNQLPGKTVGFIRLKGTSVTRGYYNDPVTTGKVISKDGWLNTGDLGFLYNQRLTIVGRSKEIIIVNGQNYYPFDLERVAGGVEGIEPGKIAVTSAFNTKLHAEEVLSFVVFKKDIKEFIPLAIQLRLHIIDKIGVEVHQIIPIEKIPVTTSGKIQRYKLRDRYLNGDFASLIEELISLRRQMRAIQRNLSKSEVQKIITHVCKEVLQLENINIYENFFDLGGSSTSALRVRAKLEGVLGTDIDEIALFKYPTIHALADYLSGGEPGITSSDQPGEKLAVFINERRVIRQRIKKNLTFKRSASENKNGLEIAVIGMSCRFPGANNHQEYWDNLRNGVESICFFSDEELIECGMEPHLLEHPHYVKAKGVLAEVNCFDTGFFGYTPLEAEKMDPQVRLLHECAWEALEDAGYNHDGYTGLIGVYVGASPNHSWEAGVLSGLVGTMDSAQQFINLPLVEKDFMTTRISYKLNLTGPSFNMYTACSTSLVSIDLACQGLLLGRCDMALAGGISILLPQKFGYKYEDGLIFSRDGHNRTFAQQASGTVFGDGAGIVVLKRLDDAIRDNDHIDAVIKGSAINNDGDRKIGFTAPAVEGQAEVIKNALDTAGVKPGSIGFVEAHGTATNLGDTIEIEALKLAFSTDKKGYCAIGSVKSNIGHANVAAGIGGLIKAVLSIKHRQIPPSLHFDRPNCKINFEESPFYVNTRLKEWKSNGYPLRAGVSSFGIGGTNAHVILEEAPKNSGLVNQQVSESVKRQQQRKTEQRKYQLILLSAKIPPALDRMTENLAEYLKKIPSVNLADAAYTLQQGRVPGKFRRMVLGTTVDDIVRALSPDTRENMPHKPEMVKAEERPVVFMFPGQGSQYVNMGFDIYRSEPVFREEMDRCFEIFRTLTGYDIKEILYPEDSVNGVSVDGFAPPPNTRDYPLERGTPELMKRGRVFNINQTEIAQPALFMIEYALAKLLIQWGIKPDAMIGHSIGEYVAACLAGVFSLEDALTIVASRGRLMNGIPPGKMIGVPMSEEAIKPFLNEHLSLAAVNTQQYCVVSGSTRVVQELACQLEAEGIQTRPLHTSHAFHSHMMESILGVFEGVVKKATVKPPKIPFISNISGTWVTAEEINKSSYWSDHVRQTVRFSDGLTQLLKKERALFLEVGPGKTLSTFAQQHQVKQPDQRMIDLLRHPRQAVTDDYHLLSKIGQLWLYGGQIDWQKFSSLQQRYRISLPTYSFEGNEVGDGIGAFHQSISLPKPDISKWFYIPGWKHSISLAVEKERRQEYWDGGWLIFMDDVGIGDKILEQLEPEAREVIVVKPGTRFGKRKRREFTINPEQDSDYERLFRELAIERQHLKTLVHLWGISAKIPECPGIDEVKRAEDFGFYSIINIAQSIGRHFSDSRCRLMVVTNNMHDVTGLERLCPEKALLLGPVKGIAREYPGMICRSIDIDLPQPGSENRKKLVKQLLVEMTGDLPESLVAFRNKRRWVQTFEPVSLERCHEKFPLLKDEGVYLITGGLENTGLRIASQLVRSVPAKLVLIHHDFFPGKDQWKEWTTEHGEDDHISVKIKTLRQLEERGGQVMVLTADLADETRMNEALGLVKRQWGRIDGVFHAVDRVDGTLIAASTRELSEHILADKVKGLLVLDRLLAAEEPNFWVLCTSINWILAYQGHAAQGGANAFLDAFAAFKASRGKSFTLAIAWDRWQNGEMAGTGKNLPEGLYGSELTGGITLSEGMETLQRALAHRLSRVIISPVDINHQIEEYQKSMVSGGDRHCPLAGEASQGIQLQRPELSRPFVPPQDPFEKELAAVWETYFGLQPVGVDDDFFELGGDSIKALGLAARVYSQLKIEIPVAEFLRLSTIRQLAQYLREHAAERKDYTSIAITEKKAYYPASINQKRMYLLNTFNERNADYNISGVLRVSGKLDIERLNTVICQLLARHEILRTGFEMREGELVQKIYDTVNFQVRQLTIRKNKWDDDNYLRQMLSELIKPFDLSVPPLMRMAVAQCAQDQYVLLFDIHHIIFDGTSMAILFREFNHLYEGSQLPELELQYRDYSEWQHSTKDKEHLVGQEKFWSNEMSGELPILDIPLDYPRAQTQHFDIRQFYYKVEKELLEKLEHLALQTGSTLYMVLLTAYVILIHKYTGQEDIIVGAIVSARERVELENLIGVFINTIPLRNFPRSQQTVAAFLDKVKKNMLRAYEHQSYPYEMIVDNLHLKRDLSHTALFDTIFVFQNMQLPKLETGGANFTPVIQRQPYKKVDFSLEVGVIEDDGSLPLMLEYIPALFKKETMERFAGHYVNVLRCIVGDRKMPLFMVQVMGKNEKQKILDEFNDTSEDFPAHKPVYQLFQEQVSKCPDHVALGSEQQGFTYRTLNERANALSRCLRQKGIGRDGMVSILLDRSPLMLESIIATWKAGGAYIPLDLHYPIPRLLGILEDSASILLLTCREAMEKGILEGYQGSIILPDDGVDTIDTIEMNEITNLDLDVDMASMAYVIYTSGSTGRPKGAVVEQAGMLNHMQAKARDLNITETNIISQNSPHTFDISVWQFFTALMRGGKTIIYSNDMVLDACKFIERVHTDGITILEVVPSYLAIILEHVASADWTFQHLEYMLVTGEEVKVDLVNRWWAAYPNIPIINAYGPTEASDDITHYVMDKPLQVESVPLGKPLHNLKIYIMDECMQLCPIGVGGVICVSGIGVGRGYLNDMEKTANAFTLDPFAKNKRVRLYKTGDLGSFQEDGTIKFLGRKDYQVKIRGYRIELREIQNRLLAHAHIKDALVMNQKDAKGDSYLCAYLVGRESRELNKQEIKDYLAGDLPEYMVPAYLMQLREMPLTPNGKIDQKALPLPHITAAVEGGYTPPRNDIERKLVAIWSEVLEVDEDSIGIDSNFFEMGGHSLKATILTSRIHKKMEVKVPLADVFKSRTIRELAKLIKPLGKSQYTSIVPAEKKEYYPLSPAQNRLYILNQLQPLNIGYNMSDMRTLDEKVDKEVLETIFIKLIQRHESLRTSFEMIAEKPIQIVHQKVSFEVEYYDETRGDDTDVKEVVENFIRPFDLTRAPLLRVRMVKTKEKVNILLMDMHHIIGDGVSLLNMVNEVLTLYGGQKLIPLALQYKDYCQWMNQQEQKQMIRQQEVYWLQEFASEIMELDLPTDFPRPEIQSFEGANISFVLPMANIEKLKTFAAQEEVTLFILFLTLLYILLSKISGNEDIIVGTPIAGRKHPDLEPLIGMFVNTLALRNYPAGNKTFKEFLSEVKERTIKAFENQEYQFDHLVSQVLVNRNPSRNPLYDVMFVFQDGADKHAGKGLDEVADRTASGKMHYQEKVHSVNDITLSVLEGANTITYSIIYCTKLFKEETILRFIDYFNEIQSMVIENENCKLEDINVSHQLINSQSNIGEEELENFGF